MNVTLNIDDELLARARALVEKRGTTLNAVVKTYLMSLVGEGRGQKAARSLAAHWEQETGCSDGKRISREDIYGERALLR